MDHFRLAQNDTKHDYAWPATIASWATQFYYDKFKTIGYKLDNTIKLFCSIMLINAICLTFVFYFR